MLSASLVESFRSRLEALGLELADLRIGGTQARPLVQVRIEWPPASPGGPDAQARRLVRARSGAPPGAGGGRGARARGGTVADGAGGSRMLEAWLDGEGPL